MGFGGLPDGSRGEIATGYISGDGSSNIVGDIASRTWGSQGFKVGQNTDINSLWVKIFKNGNPTNNLQLFIYDDNAGSPNALITNGTATDQKWRQHSDKTDGEWVKFTFPVAPSLTGGTQYHITMKSSGAVDASNYWRWAINQTNTYPHG